MCFWHTLLLRIKLLTNSPASWLRLETWTSECEKHPAFLTPTFISPPPRPSPSPLTNIFGLSQLCITFASVIFCLHMCFVHFKPYFHQLKHRNKDYVGAGGWRTECPVGQIECLQRMWKGLLCLGEICPLYTGVIFPTLNLWGNERLEGWKILAQNRLFEVYGGSYRYLKYRIARV